MEPRTQIRGVRRLTRIAFLLATLMFLQALVNIWRYHTWLRPAILKELSAGSFLPSASSSSLRKISLGKSIETKPTLSQDDGRKMVVEKRIGGCLLIMDDNHWLIEWLAYHYFVLPLTDLVVAVDPNSKTSPEPILSRWRDRMKVEVWNDTIIDFPSQRKRHSLEQQHRLRQRYFYTKCLKHHKAHAVKWVMLTDTDEFVRTWRSDEELEYGIVLQTLEQENCMTKCITMPRYQFGGQDPDTPLPLTLPNLNISLHNFMTARFQYRQNTAMVVNLLKYRGNTTMLLGKNLVNLQALSSFPEKPSLIVHNFLPECPFDSSQNAPVIHHYAGTPEQFSFRQDPRKGYFRPNHQARSMGATTHDSSNISSWINNFVDFVGPNEAMRLLRDIGELEKASRQPIFDCGCPNTCDQAAQSKKNKNTGITCRSRIQYLMDKYDKLHNDACEIASSEKGAACGGECNPNVCAYYHSGMTNYHLKSFNDFRSYQDIENETPQMALTATTWVLPNKLLYPTRNHDSVFVENGNKQLLVNVLGRHSRHVQVTDLLTGKQWAHSSKGYDPDGFPLNDLNHVYTVLVDSIQGDGKKELWLPCGFKGDQINRETSIHYARILDLETLEIRAGPKLPYSGGACVAQSLQIIQNEPPMICTFGGTVDRHDSGKFLPYSTCYDRVREKWRFPFGKLPVAFDHGSISFVPPNACQPGDPARLIVLNFRTQSYGTQRGEILAHDLPNGGWSQGDLEIMSMEDPGSWYIYTNVTYSGPKDITNCPRDASGTVAVNSGREILNYGGVFYDRPNGKLRITRFSTVRSFDVCRKKWTAIGDLGVKVFALQTCASQELQISVTCGGDARHPSYKTHNSPWCIVNRLGPKHILQNRHGAPALGNFVDGFLLGATSTDMV